MHLKENVILFGWFFKSFRKNFQQQKNSWNLYLKSIFGPCNLMFEDYFMQMLRLYLKWSIRLSQFWHTLSIISAGILQINASMLSSNKSIQAGLPVQTWALTKPNKKYSKGLKSHNIGGQLPGSECEIKCSSNSPLHKSIVTRAVWHVALSHWNHMSCKSTYCILPKKKKKVGYHLTVVLTIHSYVTIRSKIWLFDNKIQWFASIVHL